MPASINGIPYILGADPARDYPSTSKGLAEWIDRNTVRPTDPRLTNARPPTSHSHTITQVSGLQAALNGKVATTDPRLTDARTPTAHQHALADVTDLQAALDGKVGTGDPRLTDSRTPTAHRHALADVDGIQAALDGKVDDTDPRLSDARTPTAHQHPVADVTGLADRLAVLEYDTGWRAFTPVGPHLTGEGKILFRRVGPAVYCRFDAVGVASTVTRYSYLTDPGFIPVGFRPEYSGRPVALMSNSNANPIYAIGIAQGSRFRYCETVGGTTLPGTGTQAITGQMQWSTLESRPSLTTLPGTPA